MAIVKAEIRRQTLNSLSYSPFPFMKARVLSSIIRENISHSSDVYSLIFLRVE